SAVGAAKEIAWSADRRPLSGERAICGNVTPQRSYIGLILLIAQAYAFVPVGLSDSWRSLSIFVDGR
ncbi:MAG: hypothetical protein AB7N71_12970, partial [Phycisphaerae bacterium]